ncbi:hypothetical protein Cyrtocomes_00923 [Candidatus Cyrtobacter comes]|uniref:DUF2336 domain-containing protein n=1 Tax=Candidatus Cyrtobacter comes TaxID=675776 RepID=A0ABU5L8U0_9RICK|nr:hypothetical protein [Candidatus Cyrtobacter comes]MDZ5762536.1 hypothetical protein [Candidatus Cyrtobacter comes]
MKELSILENLWRSGNENALIDSLSRCSQAIAKEFLQTHVLDTRVIGEIISKYPESQFSQVIAENIRAGLMNPSDAGAIINNLGPDAYSFIIDTLNPELAKEIILSSPREVSAKIFTAYADAGVSNNDLEALMIGLVKDKRFNLENISEKGFLAILTKLDNTELTKDVIEKSDPGYLFLNPTKDDQGAKSLFELGMRAGHHELIEQKILEVVQTGKDEVVLSKGVEKCLSLALKLEGKPEIEKGDDSYERLLDMIGTVNKGCI